MVSKTILIDFKIKGDAYKELPGIIKISMGNLWSTFMMKYSEFVLELFMRAGTL